MLVDTHAHLTMPELGSDLPGVLDRARLAGVTTVVTVGIDLPSSSEAIGLARANEGVVATVGVHPNDCGNLPGDWKERLRRLCSEPEVVAIGEIGLDYYRDRVDPELQRRVFWDQLELARELDLPVVIHNREATSDVEQFLRDYSALLPAGHPRGVLHCFSGDEALLESMCEAGFYISFAGPVTYQNARDLPELVTRVPQDRLLVETDSPYLAPHPHRGKKNEPALVRLVAERVAEIRGESPERVFDLTSRNASRLFGLAAPPVS